MGLRDFYDKRFHPLLWDGSRAARGKTEQLKPNFETYLLQTDKGLLP